MQIMLAFLDPGIIRKQLRGISYSEEESIIPIEKKFADGTLSFEDRKYLLTTKGYMFEIKFCKNCGIYRPPRSSHCYDCEVCV